MSNNIPYTPSALTDIQTLVIDFFREGLANHQNDYRSRPFLDWIAELENAPDDPRWMEFFELIENRDLTL